MFILLLFGLMYSGIGIYAYHSGMWFLGIPTAFLGFAMLKDFLNSFTKENTNAQ